jgi:Spy/CpxP family protein refolding chaperone
MKTNKLILIALFLISIHLLAQPPKEEGKKEQIRSLKVGFITSELSLTAEEATKFWPLYNTYDDKQFELRHKKMKAFRERMEEDLDKMSEKDAANLLSQMESNEEELYQIRKKFVTGLKGILPSLKIIKLKKAEDDFNKKLLEQYRNKGPRR